MFWFISLGFFIDLHVCIYYSAIFLLTIKIWKLLALALALGCLSDLL